MSKIKLDAYGNPLNKDDWSKLDQILSLRHYKKKAEVKQEIKDLFLELIGEDDRTDQNVTNRKYYRNELRAELRKKVEAL